MQKLPQDGLLLCSRYAFMPNKLKYCGGDQNAALFELTVTADSSSVLNNALSEFETLYPYLTLIAKSNNIRDPFDYRVVEAYWLGNDLLENVKIKGLYNHFVDGLHLKKKMTFQQFELMMGKIPKKALPHHSFHVFNIWLRTGKAVLPYTIETMDQCRISWGKIVEVKDLELVVNSPRLTLDNNKLQITTKIIQIHIENTIFELMNDQFTKTNIIISMETIQTTNQIGQI